MFKCDGCTLKISNSNFYDNQAVNGGVFLIDNQASMIATNVQLTANSALAKGGVIYIIKSSLNS